MSVDVMSVITILSVSCNVLLGILAWRRNSKTDDMADATQTAKIIAKLDTIENTVLDIKSESKSLRNEVQDMWKHITILEERIKSIENE